MVRQGRVEFGVTPDKRVKLEIKGHAACRVFRERGETQGLPEQQAQQVTLVRPALKALRGPQVPKAPKV